MFGNRYFALSGLWDSWLCHLIGLHPILIYDAPSGLPLAQLYHSPEGAVYDNVAVTLLPNKKKITTKSPEGAIYDNEAGNRYFALSGLWDSWLCHLIGLHPILIYEAPSGLPLAQFYHNPERAEYINEKVTPLANRKKITTKSPERAIYDSEAVTPLANKKKITTKSPERAVYDNVAVTPLATKKKITTKSPERAVYDNEAVTPLENKKKITTQSPEGAVYISEAVTPLAIKSSKL